MKTKNKTQKEKNHEGVSEEYIIDNTFFFLKYCITRFLVFTECIPTTIADKGENSIA